MDFAEWFLMPLSVRMFVMAIARTHCRSFLSSHLLTVFLCCACAYALGCSSFFFIVIAFSYLTVRNCLNSCWKLKRLFDWFVYCSWLSLVCWLILIIPSLFICCCCCCYCCWCYACAVQGPRHLAIFSALHFRFIIAYRLKATHLMAYLHAQMNIKWAKRFSDFPVSLSMWTRGMRQINRTPQSSRGRRNWKNVSERTVNLINSTKRIKFITNELSFFCFFFSLFQAKKISIRFFEHWEMFWNEK